jgi:hypothetical protein
MKRIYLLVLFILIGIGAHAQQTSIAGTVIDSSGVVVKGADITAKQVNTGAIYKTKSNDDGEYEFPELAAATYSIRAEIRGFAPTEKQVSVPAGETLQVFLILDPLNASLDAPLYRWNPLLSIFQRSCPSVNALHNLLLPI